jgi:hypothetical protein
VQEQARKELEELLVAKDREGSNVKLAQLRADVDNRTEALLTDEQKAKAMELAGEPFLGELVLEDEVQ